MELFILGLVLFLGCHSVRVFAADWRSRKLEQWGEKLFKGIYSLASLVGFVLLVYGFSKIRWDSPQLWSPPVAMRHIAALLMLISMVLLVAGQVPHNAIKAKLGHHLVQLLHTFFVGGYLGAQIGQVLLRVARGVFAALQ